MAKRKWSDVDFDGGDDDLEIISSVYEPLPKKQCIRVWRCVFCQFDNNHSGLQCVMCEKSNCNTPNRARVSDNTNSIPPSPWNCVWCTFTNADDKTSCSLCGSARNKKAANPKPKIHDAPSTNPTIRVPPITCSVTSNSSDATWECIYCTYLNHYLLTECEICQLSNPTNPNTNNTHNHSNTIDPQITIQNNSDRSNAHRATTPHNNNNNTHHSINPNRNVSPNITNDKMNRAKQELRRFGHRSFRPSQYPVIQDLLNGHNTLLILPTGGGKSLCFQIPILVLNQLCNEQQCNNRADDVQKGIAVIISPLISLMNDQIHKLKSVGVDAEFINSSLTKSQRRSIEQRLKSNEIEMLYCAPELLTSTTGSVMDILNKHRVITMLVIDEAHCISEWGHSFRSSFRKIAQIRDALNDPLTMACTATATQRVRDDILTQLNLNRDNCKLHIGTFDRPNIYLKTIKTETTNAEHLERIILQEIKAYQQRKRSDYKDPVIIYCGSRKETEKTANYLTKNISRLNMNTNNRYFNEMENTVGAYHGGMTDAQRKEVQNKFINGSINIIAATNAFGMGIDKDNVGLVLHKMCPLSVESYYQQIGRAGRNGEPSTAVIISDRREWKNFIAQYSQHMVNRNNPKDYVIEKIADIICNEFPLNEQKICKKADIVTQSGFDVWKDFVVDATVAEVIKMLEKYRVLQRINKNRLPIRVTFLKSDNNPGRIRRESNHFRLFNELVARRQNQNEIEIKQFEMMRKLNLNDPKELTTALSRLKQNKLITYSSLTRSGAIKLFTKEWRENVDWAEIKRNREETLEKERKMRELMNTRKCKRKMLLKYFGQKCVASNSRCCDKCNPYAT